MSTRKITNTDKSMGIHKIEPMQILDLTQSNEEVSVVMKMTTNKQTGDSIDAAKQEILDSPWHEDDAAKAFVEQRAGTETLQDPVARLRKVNELLGRR